MIIFFLENFSDFHYTHNVNNNYSYQIAIKAINIPCTKQNGLVLNKTCYLNRVGVTQ